MKKTFIVLIILASIGFSCEPDKPDILKREAKIKIENTSDSNYITGVYYGTVGPGTNNRISSNIGPNEYKIFTINIEDDSVYDIRVTSDLTGHEEFTDDHYDFGWDETYIIELTNSGWYTDTSW